MVGFFELVLGFLLNPAFPNGNPNTVGWLGIFFVPHHVYILVSSIRTEPTSAFDGQHDKAPHAFSIVKPHAARGNPVDDHDE